MTNSWIELDLDVLAANVRAARAALGPAAELIFVVKANAYGHGLRAVAARAWREGVRWFAVANVEEASELRAELPDASILAMGGLAPSDVDEALRANVIAARVSEEAAATLAAAARARGTRLRGHAKVDTGMGRLGIDWEGAPAAIARLDAAGGLAIEGICSHFSSSGESPEHTALQASRFEAVRRQCAAAGLRIPFAHIANSGGFLRHPAADLSGVRLGILLYGYGGVTGRLAAPLRPFLQWKTRVLQVKRVPAGAAVGYDRTHVTASPTTIAVLGAGYADGYSRRLSEVGVVIVGGRRVPVAGRISMNFTTVDLGPDAAAREGDAAVLLGADGGASVWADEIARWCGTIPYEILTSIRSPLRRFR